MSEFNDRPHKNEKADSIKYVKSLIEQARTDSRVEDIPKLEKLIQLLNSKKYGLVWEEHAELVEEEMKTKIPVFVEDESKKITGNPDSDDYNFLLEGDNLHSLHLLTKTHTSKIDVIYIDPPYNTGNKDFKYNDAFVDKEDSFSHSKWLSFMERRLKIAQDLLAEDGVIFVSIDDNELFQLKLLLDEIFGEDKFVAAFVWQKKTQPSFLSKQVANVTEYIVAYRKNQLLKLKGGETDPNKAVEMLNISNQTAERVFNKSSLILKNGEFNGLLKSGTYGNGELKVELLSDVQVENGIPQSNLRIKGRFKWKQLKIDEAVSAGGVVHIKSEKTLRPTLLKNDGIIKIKPPISLLGKSLNNIPTNTDATSELKNLFEGVSPMDFPKPSGLIKFFVEAQIFEKKSAIILDFFAGSGTTGQAVIELNAEDGGNRKFILATNNENNIAEEVTYERMKRVSAGTDKYEAKPLNLKYFKTDFIVKEDFPDISLEYELLEYVTPLVELEFAVDITNPKVQIVLNEDQLEYLIDNNGLIENSTLFMHPDVFRDAEQNQVLSDLQIKVQEIPNYFFGMELWSK